MVPTGAAQRFDLVAFGLDPGDSVTGWGSHKTSSDNFDFHIRPILCSRCLECLQWGLGPSDPNAVQGG